MNRVKPNKIVTIGGGGGHAQVLKALKPLDNQIITGICPSTDSGGSTGVLRKQYGANGYTGDLTKCIAALCPDDEVSKALMYRYGSGALHGHSVKNLLLYALEDSLGEEKGLKKLWQLCDLEDHRVLPVTKEQTQLHAKLKMGKRISSETNIDTLAKNPLWHPDIHAIKSIYLKPNVSASKDVLKALSEADVIIISPGDLYSSIIPTLMPKGMKKVLSKSKAKIIMVLNIVNKRGETDRYTADDFIGRIENYIGRKVDIVFCNNKSISSKVLAKYALEEKVVFKADVDDNERTIICAPFATLGDDGAIVHDIKELRKQFIKVIKTP